MRKKLIISLLPFILFSSAGLAQQQDTLFNKLDSLNKKTDSIGKQVNNIDPKVYNKATKLTFNSYFILLGSDLKQEFTKPFHMNKIDWTRFGKFAAVAVAAGFADEPVQRFSVKLTKNNPGVKNVSKFITNFGGLYEAYTLAALAGGGIIFKNQKLLTTTLLSTQAYLTGAALENVIKLLSGRTRPYSYSPDVEAEPTFLGPFSKASTATKGKKIYSSFPSGHTTVAFAAATVFALEYKNRPYVPIIAYTAATAIGLSRITENKHWLSDVVLGAGIGYLAGRNVVNNYHRYAKIKAPSKKKNVLSFNLDFANGRPMPGLTYQFK